MAGILSYEPAFHHRISDNFGYVLTVGDAYKLLSDFETRTTTKFSCFKADKGFGNIGKYQMESFQKDCHDCKINVARFGPQTSRDFLFVFVNRLLKENS